MTFLRNYFTYIMVFFLLISPTGVFANSSAWYLFSQGTSESSADIENIPYIQVLSEKLSIQIDEKEQSFLPPKNPSFWSYFLNQGKTAEQIQADTAGGKIWPTLLGYTGNRYSTDTQISATYVMSNTSEKALSIETGFSFFNKMEYNHGSYEMLCPEYASVDDALLPQNFQIRSGNKVIPSSVEFINRPGSIQCTKDYLNEKYINNPIQWILPVGHYTLNFQPKETKTVKVSYRTHLFGYGADYSYGRSAIFYDFEPIFSWGKGKIGKVDIVLTYPTKYEARFTKGTSFVKANEKYRWYRYVTAWEWVSLDDGTSKMETIVPTSTNLLAKNLIQNTYSYKNVTIESGMKALHFWLFDYLNNVRGDGFNITDETFWLVCVSPGNKIKRFANLFPGGKIRNYGEFVGYATNDTENGLLVTKVQRGKDFEPELIEKSALLPKGTVCNRF